ncbi:MAG: ABC transporter permease [Spirochaetaceae bacterium]|jgi:D-methionine transport system permease protein|nr:ABC transporter permease [Spirochaetaceae bacterium]
MIQTIINAFGQKTWFLVGPAVIPTLYMAGSATVLTLMVGLIFGSLLFLTRPDGLAPFNAFNTIFGSVINALRSLPAIIMIIVTLPLSKLLVGITYGPKACIVALSCTCIPMFSRLVENSFLEVSRGKIEAAISMGAKIIDIMFKVVLPECLPVLIRNSTFTIVAIIGTTTLAGYFGAGGLGDTAVRYGYARFQGDVLLACVLVLFVIIHLVQLLGDLITKGIIKKWHI